MTAQHLFSIASDQMARRVTSARCKPVDEAKEVETGPALVVAGAHPMGPLARLKDIAVFPIKGWSPGLSLADAEPRLGDVVWLLATVAGGREVTAPAHRARVVSTREVLAYLFDDPTIGLDQTSGGAIVNVEGDVVGQNIGYGRTPTGRIVGVANPLGTLRAVRAQLP